MMSIIPQFLAATFQTDHTTPNRFDTNLLFDPPRCLLTVITAVTASSTCKLLQQQQLVSSVSWHQRVQLCLWPLTPAAGCAPHRVIDGFSCVPVGLICIMQVSRESFTEGLKYLLPLYYMWMKWLLFVRVVEDHRVGLRVQAGDRTWEESSWLRQTNTIKTHCCSF